MLVVVSVLPMVVVRGSGGMRDDGRGNNLAVVWIVAVLAGMGAVYLAVLRVRRWRG